MTLQELRDKKGLLAQQAQDVLDVALRENRELSGEETQKFDAVHADIDKISATIQRIEKQDALGDGAGRRSEAPQPGDTRRIESRGGSTRPRTDLAQAVRCWMTPANRRTDQMREIVTRAGFSDNEITLHLPTHALRETSREGLREWEERNDLEQRTALGVGSGAIGGYTVADETMQALEVSLLEFGGMRQVARIVRTATGGALPFPTVNDTGNKGRIIGENAGHTETGTTFGQIVLEAYKYSSDYILVSIELLQDGSFNVAEFIGRALGERIGRITNDHFTTGTGSSEPKGVVVASSQGLQGATGQSTSVIYNDLVDLLHSVDPAYRNRARWMFADSTLKALKKIKVPQFSGDTAGVPLWQPGLVAGQPDSILGYPFTINQSMAAMAASAKSILFGDLSKYLIRDVRDVMLARADERYFEYGQVGFLAMSRHDGDLLDSGTDPVKHYANSAA